MCEWGNEVATLEGSVKFVHGCHKSDLDSSIAYCKLFFCKVWYLNPLSRGSSVGIATCYGPDIREVGVRVAAESKFSLLHVVQTGSGVHATSYPMSAGGSFPGGKAAGA
jgi:hypothetical protein